MNTNSSPGSDAAQPSPNSTAGGALQPAPWTARLRTLGLVLLAVIAGGVGVWTLGPRLGLVKPPASEVAGGDHQAADHDHPGHGHSDHDHADHDHGHSDAEEETAVYLTAEALQSAGITVGPVTSQPFERTIRVPGIVVDWPGRSRVEVPAPLTGVVTKVFAVEGEAVGPDQPLCELRLTQEDLVQTQADFLRKIESLDVVQREIDRLEKVAEEGVIARKSLLATQYQRQQLEAELRAQGQALLLHGLSTEQVDQIRGERKLLSLLTIKSPRPADAPEGTESLMLVEQLKISPGQSIVAGSCLVVLADHQQLAVEGRAFEQDLPALETLAAKGGQMSIVIEGEGRPPQTVAGLTLSHLANQVDPNSRTMRFYLSLPNQRVRDQTNADGRRVVDWQFRPGQRVQILLPVEIWQDRLVLPLAAVAQDGAENYVFLEDHGHFHRKSVQIEYRDPQWVVVTPGGTLSSGDTVVLTGAHQLLLTWKNKVSGGAPPEHDHEH